MTTPTPPTASSVTINRAVTGPAHGPVKPAITLIGSAGSRIELPFQPASSKVNRGNGWTNIDRPGGGVKPILARGKGVLKTLGFQVMIGYFDFTPVDAILLALDRAADGPERWAVGYGPLEQGLWRITNMDLEATDRDHLHRAVRATADMQFTEAGPAVGVGPVTGGVNSLHLQQRPATYTVRSGDTFTGIAVKFYGEARYIWLIANVNGLRNWNLHVGQVLKLPRAV